jgi:hypothetical protein
MPRAVADCVWEVFAGDSDVISAYARVAVWNPVWVRSFLKWSGAERLALDGIDVAGCFAARWKQDPVTWLTEVLPLIDVKKEDRTGQGLFWWALRYGDSALIRTLVRAGVEACGTDEEWCNILEAMVEGGGGWPKFSEELADAVAMVRPTMFFGRPAASLWDRAVSEASETVCTGGRWPLLAWMMQRGFFPSSTGLNFARFQSLVGLQILAEGLPCQKRVRRCIAEWLERLPTADVHGLAHSPVGLRILTAIQPEGSEYLSRLLFRVAAAGALPEEWGRTVLYMALAEFDLERVALLLDSGVSVAEVWASGEWWGALDSVQRFLTRVGPAVRVRGAGMVVVAALADGRAPLAAELLSRGTRVYEFEVRTVLRKFGRLSEAVIDGLPVSLWKGWGQAVEGVGDHPGDDGEQ